MQITDQKLKELLVRPGYIKEQEFNRLIESAKKENIDPSDIIVEKELLKDEQLGQLFAQAFDLPFVNLRNEKIDEAVFKVIPEQVARKKGVVVFARDKDFIKAGMIDPEDLVTRHIIEKRFGQKLKVFLITKRDLEQALHNYRASLKDELSSLLENIQNQTEVKEGRDSIIIKLVNMILEYGYYNKASDIHIEPYYRVVTVRYRIDGVLHNVFELPHSLEEIIISRIKILAKMRTDEHQAAQDGKFQFIADNKPHDVRVSIVPVTAGENIVMRLLSSEVRQLSLDDLGLSGADLGIVKKAVKNPHGMILVTGPTGCGKTTTIYELLKILNIEAVHISTIEDPVEYDIEGISQIQVNQKTNLTFALGLRAIVRQDPDIIMVGEIRDTETAQIAVNSAMTGHLVLSTLHANDAATTLPRLQDMKIEPFLIASTVNIVIAQRLVRKICEKCRASYAITKDEKAVIESEPNIAAAFKDKIGEKFDKAILYHGVGCSACAQTGFKGRMGLFEILEMSETVKKLVLNRSSSSEILKAARAEGMTTMLQDGINKAINGATTLSEALRVTWG